MTTSVQSRGVPAGVGQFPYGRQRHSLRVSGPAGNPGYSRPQPGDHADAWVHSARSSRTNSLARPAQACGPPRPRERVLLPIPDEAPRRAASRGQVLRRTLSGVLLATLLENGLSKRERDDVKAACRAPLDMRVAIPNPAPMVKNRPRGDESPDVSRMKPLRNGSLMRRPFAPDRHHARGWSARTRSCSPKTQARTAASRQPAGLIQRERSTEYDALSASRDEHGSGNRRNHRTDA